MPKSPRDVTQGEVVRALVKAGGQELRNRGKGSHRMVKMPNMDRPVVVPTKLSPDLWRPSSSKRGCRWKTSWRRCDAGVYRQCL